MLYGFTLNDGRVRLEYSHFAEHNCSRISLHTSIYIISIKNIINFLFALLSFQSHPICSFFNLNKLERAHETQQKEADSVLSSKKSFVCHEVFPNYESNSLRYFFQNSELLFIVTFVALTMEVLRIFHDQEDGEERNRISIKIQEKNSSKTNK